MRDIFVIYTIHMEYGACNSVELYKIIERIGPEVIFEELSRADFNRCYAEQAHATLETSAVKMYLRDRDITHLPVDTYSVKGSDNSDFDLMDRHLEKEMAANIEYRNLCNELALLEYHKGFEFLNSSQCCDGFEKLRVMKEKTVNSTKDERLLYIHGLRNETVYKRENEMIANICDYSRKHDYSTALMFIGAGHRKSIMENVQKHEKNEALKLNWIFNGYEYILSGAGS